MVENVRNGNDAFDDPVANRARGALRHFAGLLTPDAAAGLHAVIERDLPLRLARLRDHVIGNVADRFRPRGPRMRALVVGPGARVGWRDVAQPQLTSPQAALVRPIAVATCDLDRPMGLGRTPIVLPLHLGHECVAEVVEIGAEVTVVRTGDRVVVPFQISCGACASCFAGFTAHCAAVPPLSMYGFGLTGGLWGGAIADLVAVPYADAMLVPLPSGVDPTAAASAADNLSSAYCKVAPHIPRVISRGDGARVLILAELHRRPPFGVSMPLYAGQIAQAMGVEEVHVVDRNPAVRAHALRLGLQPHAPSALRKLPLAPLVVDATGTSAGLRVAVSKTASDGVCASIGSLHARSSVPTALMYFRDISLSMGMPPARPVLPDVLNMIADRSIQPQDVITDVDRIDNAPRAIQHYLKGTSTKTVLSLQ
jgi:alcohol dehydrogenase